MTIPTGQTNQHTLANDTLISGQRTADGRALVWVDEDRPLPQVVHHSPGGFEWGYGGSGPADLALSILALVIGEEQESVKIFEGRTCGARAWQLHQSFKREVVAGLEHDAWSLSVGQVKQWIADREQLDA